MRSNRTSRVALVALGCALTLAGCMTSTRPPLKIVDHVDIPRFMGDWFVIANIPTFVERDAYNAVESYSLAPDGRVRTVFTFHRGSFAGPLKRYEPVGFVKEGSGGAVWGMRFIWPIKADYRVMYLDESYSQTVVGREKRDYVWIMARTPTLPDSDYQRLTAMLQSQGYDVSKIQKVPQQQRAAAEPR